jgi:hypothetical protein
MVISICRDWCTATDMLSSTDQKINKYTVINCEAMLMCDSSPAVQYVEGEIES